MRKNQYKTTEATNDWSCFYCLKVSLYLESSFSYLFLADAATKSERSVPMPFHRSASFQNLVQSQYGHELDNAAPQKLSMAQAALCFANIHTSLGSSNLGVGHLTAIKPWTPCLPDPDVINYMLLSSRPKRANCGLKDYVSAITKSQVGNCGEKNILVCYFLLQQATPVKYHRVFLWPDDHEFVVLSQEPSEQGLFPENFNDWNDDAVVIDPWIGICASARHYPELWRMKLDTMAAVGIELRAPCFEKGKWLKANVSSWKNMLDNNQKYTLRAHPLSSQCP